MLCCYYGDVLFHDNEQGLEGIQCNYNSHYSQSMRPDVYISHDHYSDKKQKQKTTTKDNKSFFIFFFIIIIFCYISEKDFLMIAISKK